MSEFNISRVIAFIPARSGSKRIRNKNIRPLAGKSLIQRTISEAKIVGDFDKILVLTDSEEYLQHAYSAGADESPLRPDSISSDVSPDIDWLKWSAEQGLYCDDDTIVILRPTSPFRTARHISEALRLFQESPEVESVRAVCKCSRHPGKTWFMRDGFGYPLYPFNLDNGVPWHSSQSNTLPVVYEQNAAIEVFRGSLPLRRGLMVGEKNKLYLMSDIDSVDINTELDFKFAEYLLKEDR